MFKIKNFLSICILLVSCYSFADESELNKINSKSYILMDYETGQVLSKERSDERLAPASLTKNKIDHRLVEYFKVNINCDTKWFNPEFSFTENPEYKNGLNNSNSSSNTNRGDVSNYKKCQEIKPVIMLEMLQNLGYITVDKVQHNTQGEDFWSYQLQNGKKFKTSVKTKSFLFENDKNLYSPQNEIFN